MRLQILSDLHLEFGPVKIPRTDADVVVLAGDIHLGRAGRMWARSQFPNTPVIYILGNHEFYRHSLPGLTETLRRETDGSHIHLLENSAVDINGVTFLGCTLWTDFQLSPEPAASMRNAERIMADYMIIQFEPENRTLRAKDTVQLHSQSVAWLRSTLSNCDPRRTVIVTHHAPSARSEPPHHANSPLSPAFASDLDSLITFSGVPLWIHGHTHYNVDYVLGSTRVLSNQRGYPDEVCKNYNPELVIEI